jgi:hypothetical protein
MRLERWRKIGFGKEDIRVCSYSVYFVSTFENQITAVETEGLHRPQHSVPPKPRPPVSRSYVERPQIQDVLTEYLLPLSLTQQPRCVLYSLGGSGKTQVASFWIEKNQHR